MAKILDEFNFDLCDLCNLKQSKSKSLACKPDKVLSDFLIEVEDYILGPLKIKVLFLKTKINKWGRRAFFKTENGTLHHAYMEWTETVTI